MAVLKVAFLSSAVLEFFSSISIALLAVYLGMYYLGYIDFGAYGRPLAFSSGFFILLLAPDFFLPLRELGAHYHARADAVGAAQEILKVLDQAPMAAPSAAPRPDVRMPRQIRLQGVSVRYRRTDQQGLKRIDLTIAQGERIAVVGESGAGKSTLIHLLLGFVTPTDGRILLDHRPLTDIDITAWRRHCAWIGQRPMIFTGTLKDNIAMARSEPTEEQIEAAARKAGVLEFADRWESGLDTVVGEQGLGLSVGQAQRVALARAFIQDALLLLLDEPTASLDRSTEAEILSNLAEWSRGRTVVMATHRPAALALADRILILKKGELISQGDYQHLKQMHGELLAHGSG
jgi:ATP-binding cassette subfamily C protein CydD